MNFDNTHIVKELDEDSPSWFTSCAYSGHQVYLNKFEPDDDHYTYVCFTCQKTEIKSLI